MSDDARKFTVRTENSFASIFPEVWLRLRRLGYSSTTWRSAAEEQLRDVEHLHVFPSLRARHAVGHHIQTKRAGRRERARAGSERLLRTQTGDALGG